MPNQPAAPVISVIMIFLDAEPFIAEAIDSVIAQTEPRWELLLVDDGSSDGSTEIARRYASRDPGRIRYLEHPRHENRGMSASRNLGLAHARGEFVAFLDADDVYLPERLARHLAVLRSHPEVGMVFGPTLFWHTWSDPGAPDVHDSQVVIRLEPGRMMQPPSVLIDFLESGGATLPGICSVLARRQVIEDVGGFEERFRGCYEDQVFLSKMSLHTPVIVVNEVLAKYRQHPASHCSRAIETGEYDPGLPHPARERYLRWLDGYVQAHAPADRRLRAALQAELWPYRKSWVYALKQSQAFPYVKRAVRLGLPLKTYSWLRERMLQRLSTPRALRKT